MKRGDAVYEVPAPAAQGLLDTEGVARFLSVSPRKIQDLVRAGLPFVDLSTDHDPRRRPKRMLRFIPSDVLAWVRARAAGGGGDGR